MRALFQKKYIFHYFSLSLFDSHLLYLKSNKGVKEGVNYKMHRLPNKRFEQPHYSQDVMYKTYEKVQMFSYTCSGEHVNNRTENNTVAVLYEAYFTSKFSEPSQN